MTTILMKTLINLIVHYHTSSQGNGFGSTYLWPLLLVGLIPIFIGSVVLIPLLIS